LKLLVYEHASGGGFCGKPIPPSILAEGYAMLRTIVSDFKAAGHNVLTLLDSRLASFDPPMEADFKIKVSSPKETDIALRRIFTSADAAYIIAPETNGILQNLVHSTEQASLLSLNCCEDAIEK
jgi:predicted ATP-grasp superfamily ATP-dependent carboligase